MHPVGNRASKFEIAQSRTILDLNQRQLQVFEYLTSGWQRVTHAAFLQTNS